MSEEPSNGIVVKERFLPFPAGISPQARATLAAMGANGLGRSEYPAPGDVAGWVAHIERSNAGLEQMLAPLAGRSDTPVETRTIAGVTVHVGTPAGMSDRARACAYIDIHGGALIGGAGEACRMMVPSLADRHGVTVYAVDYRVPPHHCYPAALDDCLAVYRALLPQYGAANIVIGGGSAGGNLAAATVLRGRDEGLPLPAGLVLQTPELDLTESGDSFEVNKYADVVLVQGLGPVNELYAAGADLDHPYLSPLFGDFSQGFPPTFLQAGTRDLFLSNAVRMHRALRKAQVPVELHIFEGMPHGGFFGAPEDDEMRAEMQRFVASCWPQ